MKRLTLLFLTLTVMLLFVPVVSADAPIIQSKTNGTTQLTFRFDTSTSSEGFNITGNATTTVSRIEVNLFKTGTPTGNVWIDFMTVNSTGLPSNTIIASSDNVSIASLTATSTDYVNFTFTNLNITNTGNYSIVLRANNTIDGANYMRTVYGGQTGYSVFQKSGGGTWTTIFTNSQINYRLFGNPITNITLSAYNLYTNTSINSFCVNITGNYTCTTNGTATITTILSNSTQLWSVQYLSNESGGYFNETYTSVNVSSNVNKSMAQNVYSFYAVEKVTGVNLTGFNFSSVRGSTTYAINQTHYLSNGTYNITPFKSGYYNISVPVTATNYFNSTQNISGVYNQSLNLTVKYLLNLSNVQAFSVVIYSTLYNWSESFNVTGAQINLNLTSNINYSIIVNVTDTFGNSTTFMSALNQSNLTVYVGSTTQFNLYFFDENTLAGVNNVNYTIVGSTYAYNGSTGTGSNNANFTGLQNDNYEIRYTQNGGNYTYRSYFVNVPLTSTAFANLSLYMLPVSNATDFILTATDSYNQPQAGFTVSLLRRYAINGQTTYYVVEMMQPSVALGGQTPFVAVANTVPYIFRVQDSNGNVLFQGAGTSSTNLETLYLISTNVYIKVQTSASVLAGANNFQGLSTALTNTSTAFQLTWSDASLTLSQICIQVFTNTTTLQGTSCSNLSQSAGVIGYTYNPVNGTLYTANVYAYSTLDGEPYLIGNPIVDDRRSTNTTAGWGYIGVFFVIVIMMTIAIQLADRVSVGILIGSLTMFVFFTVNAFGRIIEIPTATSAILGSSFLVIGIIIMVAMREEF